MSRQESVANFVNISVKAIREVAIRSPNKAFVDSLTTALKAPNLGALTENLTRELWAVAEKHHGVSKPVDPTQRESSTSDFEQLGSQETQFSRQKGSLKDPTEDDPGAGTSQGKRVCSLTSSQLPDKKASESSRSSTQSSSSQLTTDSCDFDDLIDEARLI